MPSEMRGIITIPLGEEEPKNLRPGDIIPLGTCLFKVRDIVRIPFGYQSAWSPKDNLSQYALKLEEVFDLKEWDENEP